jgi:hypothetical protein
VPRRTTLFAAVVLSAVTASADEKNWVGGSGFWDVGANWGGSKPAASDDAYVDSGATVSVRTAGEKAARLEFGYYSTAAGSLVVEPGASLQLGYLVHASSSGSISSLTLKSNATLTTDGGQIGSYGDATASLAGILNCSSSLIVGLKGSGDVTQTAGATTIGGSLSLGPITATATGTYRLLGGTLSVARGGNDVALGEEGTGALLLGDAVGAGTLTQHGGGSGVNLKVGQFNDYGGGFTILGTGLVRGHGSVGLTGGLSLNHGKTIADGHGVDRTLSLASFSSIVNDHENVPGSASGWYAVNRGKLTLPPIAVAAGTGSYNWGESPTDAAIDLVNSVRLTLSGVSSAGTVSIALLATGRSDVAPGLPGIAIGVWDVSASTSFTSAVLRFRYDDALPPDPSALRVLQFTGGSWSDVTAALSVGNRTIDSIPVSGFSQFALVVPEPVSLALLPLAALPLRRKR